MTNLIVKLLFLSSATFSMMNCSHDENKNKNCDKNCLSDILAMTKNNFTAMKSSVPTIKSVFYHENKLKEGKGDDNNPEIPKNKNKNESFTWSSQHQNHNDNDLLDYFEFNEQLLKKPKVLATEFAPKINANEKGKHLGQVIVT